MSRRQPVLRRSSRVARLLALLVGAFYLLQGSWAFVAPGTLYSSIAVFPPYNGHFLHDAGAFQVGLGVALVLGAIWIEALPAATLAVLAASVLHLVAHLEDRGMGGHATDFIALLLICVLLALAAALDVRGGRDLEGESAGSAKEAEV